MELDRAGGSADSLANREWLRVLPISNRGDNWNIYLCILHSLSNDKRDDFHRGQDLHLHLHSHHPLHRTQVCLQHWWMQPLSRPRNGIGFRTHHWTLGYNASVVGSYLGSFHWGRECSDIFREVIPTGDEPLELQTMTFNWIINKCCCLSQ